MDASTDLALESTGVPNSTSNLRSIIGEGDEVPPLLEDAQEITINKFLADCNKKYVGLNPKDKLIVKFDGLVCSARQMRREIKKDKEADKGWSTYRYKMDTCFWGQVLKVLEKFTITPMRIMESNMGAAQIPVRTRSDWMNQLAYVKKFDDDWFDELEQCIRNQGDDIETAVREENVTDLRTW